MTYRSIGCLLAVASFLAPGSVARADETREAESHERAARARTPSISHHLRLKRNREGEVVALQTAITRYVPASGEGGLVVDLIGAVHIADAGYYGNLNRHFEQYDALLYELVAPPEKRIPRPGDDDAGNPLRLVQKVAQSVLDLKHQIDLVDYTKENFVHADMSPEEMAKAIRERGDDAITLFLSVAADLLRQRNLRERALREESAESAESGKTPETKRPDAARPETTDPFEVLFDEHGSAKLKRMLAEQFAELSGSASGLGPTIDTILIKDRNAAAMRVFQKELAAGKKRIGVFYGAAHMPDFETRLVREFGLERHDVQWVTAWDLRLRRKSPVEGVLSAVVEEILRESLRQH